MRSWYLLIQYLSTLQEDSGVIFGHVIPKSCDMLTVNFLPCCNYNKGPLSLDRRTPTINYYVSLHPLTVSKLTTLTPFYRLEQKKYWPIIIYCFQIWKLLAGNEDHLKWESWPCRWIEYVLFACLYVLSNLNGRRSTCQTRKTVPCSQEDKPKEIQFTSDHSICKRSIST